MGRYRKLHVFLFDKFFYQIPLPSFEILKLTLFREENPVEFKERNKLANPVRLSLRTPEFDYFEIIVVAPYIYYDTNVFLILGMQFDQFLPP
jgi:hypothetical protein